MSSQKEINKRIQRGDFSLYDKFIYGGLGYGYICLPNNLIRIILAVLFPPFSVLLKHLNPQNEFPYITWNGLYNLYQNFTDVVFTLILTSLFWVPGVIYAFNEIKVLGAEVKEKEEKFMDSYGIDLNELNEDMIKEFMKKMRKKRKYDV